MNFCRSLVFVSVLLSGFIVKSAVLAQSSDEISTLFQSDNVLNLTLTVNFDSLFSKNYSEEALYPAMLSYDGNNGVAKKVNIDVSKRGHFRKSFDVCDFPPLRLHLGKGEIKDSVFAGSSKLKLVTHCQNSDSTFDQYLLMEYYLYKMYNLLTWRSFNVRLARIKYIDRVKTYDPMVRWAFFIENPNALARRINGMSLDIRYVQPEATDPYYYALMSLFQYMIINQDWSVSLLHNIELIGIYPSLKPITVPFDFDMAAMINIPYESPVLDYKKGKKQERKFMPVWVDKTSMYRAIFQFIKERNNIYKLINESNYLDSSIKAQTTAHLDEFYSIIGDKQLVRRTFIHPR